ncbi:tyrosine-type recombinase/integrase [Cupriavidus oxalaticus]|nr:site-specific integrase [Cupriavidus oxalaticus]
MTFDITTPAARRKLAASKEPYFSRVATGLHIGVRVLPDLTQTWTARWRDAAARKYHYRALGSLEGVPEAKRYDHAAGLARDFMQTVRFGVATTDKVVTVRDAVMAYIAHRTDKKGTTAGDNSRRSLELHVLSHSIANVQLADLHPQVLENWRKGLTKTGERERASKASANRTLSNLKASLNLAYKNHHVASDAGWRTVEKYEDVDDRRTLYLSPKQRADLLAAAPPDLRDFLRALLLTAMRVGELGRLNVGDFNAELGTVIVRDSKAKPRSVTLSSEAAELFRKQARGKLPLAPLFSQTSGCGWRSANDWGRPMRVAVKAAGLPPDTVCYSLRHSSISALLEAGVDLLTVSRMAGTGLKMLEKHYGHLEHGAVRRKLDRVKIA